MDKDYFLKQFDSYLNKLEIGKVIDYKSLFGEKYHTWLIDDLKRRIDNGEQFEFNNDYSKFRKTDY